MSEQGRADVARRTAEWLSLFAPQSEKWVARIEAVEGLADAYERVDALAQQWIDEGVTSVYESSIELGELIRHALLGDLPPSVPVGSPGKEGK